METKIEKFYNCKYDRAFKEVMLKEKNKDLLKLLLEHILKEEVKEIKIMPTERNSRNINIKRKTLDVLLKTKDKEIGIELNANIEEYVHPRNMGYISDMYASHVLVGETYDEEIMIMQINLTYGLKRKHDRKPYRRYKIQDEEGKKFVENFEIIEINMDTYMDLWYNKDKKGIEENKILVMLGLEREELEELSENDKVVSKYMEEIKKVNESPEFRRFMSAEEDERKIFNSRMKVATEKGLQQGIEQGINQRNIEIAKNLLEQNIDMNIISKSTGLSIKQLKEI